MNAFCVSVRCVCLSIAFLLSANVVQATGVQAYTDVYLLSPSTKISTLEDGWAPDSSGSYIQGKARLGSRLSLVDNWSIGVHKRLDYIVHYDQDTSDFYSAIENNELPAGLYPLNLRVNAMRSQGFELSKFIPLSTRSDLRVGFNLLSGNRVQDGLLTGVGQVHENGDISYQYNLDYFYDEQRLLDGPQIEVSGWGHSLDLRWQGRFRYGYSASLEFTDLFYRMYWQDLDHDQGCLVRPLSVNPLCAVAVKQEDHQQSLSSHSRMRFAKKMEYQGFNAEVSMEAEFWSRYDALWFSWGQSGYLVGVEAQNQIYRLGYESSWLKVKYVFDHLIPKSAHYGQLSMSVYWPL